MDLATTDTTPVDPPASPYALPYTTIYLHIWLTTILVSTSISPPHQPDPAHPYLSVVPLPSPRTIQIPTHDSNAPRRRLDGGVPRAAVWSGGGQARPLAVSLSAELSWLLIAPRGAYPAELLGGVPVVAHRRGQVGRDVRRTVRCRSLSTIGCPPGPVPRPVRCPAVRCPAVRCPVIRCPTVRCRVALVRRPGLACPAVWCRPSGVQLSGVRLSVLWRPSRPGSARRGPWDDAGPAGPSRLEWVGFRVAWRVPERLVDG
jgi:hypothetical protein